MIIPIRSGEWSQWAGRNDEEYFARLLNGVGWRIAIRNVDLQRLAHGTDLIDENDTMSVDSVASFWDPCRQRFEAVFIESKRRTEKPSRENIREWIDKCRRGQGFVEECEDIQRILCIGTNQENILCTKSILFIDCDGWRDIRTDRLLEILPIQTRTTGSPRRVQIIDHLRALWLQHTLDILGLLRSPIGNAVQKYKVYYWKRGFHENVSFDHLTSEVLLFEIDYGEERRDLTLIIFENMTTEVSTYYANSIADLLDAGAHGYNRLIIYVTNELDQLAVEGAQNVFRDRLIGLTDGLGVEVRVRTLPTGLNR